MIDDSQLELSEEAIRQRSRQIWEREGRPEGHAQDHWLRAKAELEAEQEHWMRARTELEAEMEKTAVAHPAAPAGRMNDLLRSIREQAGALLPKASLPAAPAAGTHSQWKIWYDDVEKFARALSGENFAGEGDEALSTGPQSPPLAAVRRSKQTSAAPSIICADIVLHGALDSAGEIQLDGCVEGNVYSAVLVVGDKGVIQGEVIADDVTVRGRIRGSIRARKVHLCSGARVEGDILYATLATDAGAQIEGRCRYAGDPLSLEEALTATFEPAVPEDAVQPDLLSEVAPRSQTAAA